MNQIDNSFTETLFLYIPLEHVFLYKVQAWGRIEKLTLEFTE